MEGNKLKEASFKLVKAFKSLVEKLKKAINDRNLFSFPKKRESKASYKIVDLKRFIISLSILCFIVLIFIYSSFASKAILLVVNGEEVARVKNKKVVDIAISNLKEELEKENGTSILFDNSIDYRKAKAKKDELLGGGELEEELRKHIDFTIKAYSVYVDDNRIFCIRLRDEAEEILDFVLDEYTKDIDKSQIKEVGYAEKVEIKEEYLKTEDLISKNEGKNLIIKGSGESRSHTVQSNDTLWKISQLYDISIEELKVANPDINPQRIDIGQKINLIVPKPLISLRTVEEITYKDKVEYEKKTQTSNELHENQTMVMIEGEYGEKEVLANIIKVNGLETQREIVEEKIIKKPRDQIIVKGTKKYQ